MLVSTKGRYALRVMIDLAEHNDGSLIKLQDIADRQQISEKYLEGIIAVLSKEGLVHSVRGKGGGYRLARSPKKYTAYQIMEPIEGKIAPIACLETPQNTCQRKGFCKTLPMWAHLDGLINGYLRQVTLQELAEETLPAELIDTKEPEL